MLVVTRFSLISLFMLAALAGRAVEDPILQAARQVVVKLSGATPEAPGSFAHRATTEPGEDYYHVSFKDLFVSLTGEGLFLRYADLSPFTADELSPRQSKFPTDEAAYAAAELRLRAISEGGGFQRKSIKRSRGLIYVGLAAKPYGYWSDGGNQALVTLMEGSGRVREVMLSRGWTFEPPNVHVTPEQAVDKAIAALGGSRANWQYRLEYATWASPRAPADIQALHAKKTMRLHYNLWSDLQAAAYVDSVTGTLFDPITPEDWAERRVQRGLPPNDPIGKIDKISSGFSKVESKPVHPALLVGAGFGLGIGAFFAWSRLRTRKGH